MYSFNLDYIFNVVYNILLAIRYAFLFWLLRISPADYLKDHQYDTYDGLRDRGWIGTTDTASTVAANTPNDIYLGGTSSDSFTWWDYIKEHLFGINSGKSVVISGQSSGYSINPNDVNYVTEKTTNDPWFANLHLSVQNPYLSFFVDVISVLTFFVLCILIYIIFKWLTLEFAGAMKKKDKLRKEKRKSFLERKEKVRLAQEKYQEELKKEINKNISKDTLVKEDLNDKQSENEQIFVHEDNEASFPAGIPGLPIENLESDNYNNQSNTVINNNLVNDKTIGDVKNKDQEDNDSSDLLSRYKFQNIDQFKEKIENKKLIKIKPNFENNEKDKLPPAPEYSQKNNIVKEDFESKKEKEIVEEIKTKEEESLSKNKVKNYKEKWNIVINYMRGGEEALWRIGILEADNLLNDLLIDRGYAGETTAERLKQAEFNTIDLAWSAHKIRNRIAHHGSEFVLTERIAKNTLELYRAVFSEFKLFE